MNNLTRLQALLRVFVVFSILVLGGFTTTNASAESASPGAAANTIAAASDVQVCPPTVPTGGKSKGGNANAALLAQCMPNNSFHSSNNSGVKTFTPKSGGKNGQNSKTNLLTMPVTPKVLNSNTNKNGSGSNSGNKTITLKTNIKSLNQNSTGNGSDPKSNAKVTSKTTTNNNNNSNSSNGSNDPSSKNKSKNLTSTTTSNDPPSKNKKNDPPSGNLNSSQNSLLQQFEKLTGHKLNSDQSQKLLSEAGSSKLGNGSQFIHQLENLTGQKITNSQVASLEKSGSSSSTPKSDPPSSSKSDPPSSLQQRVEDLTHHSISTSQFDTLIDDSVSASHNSEGETRLLQELEQITGKEISASEAQRVENALGGDISQRIRENNGEGSENGSSLRQDIEDIIGQSISSSQLDALIDDEFSHSHNSEGETRLLQELENITGGEISSSEAQEIEDALGGDVDQAIRHVEEENESTTTTTTTVIEPVVVGSGIPVTGLAITNVFGEVSSLTDTNGVSTFVIGNTTLQLNDTLKSSNNFNNGDYVSVNGGFSSDNVFVGNALMSWVKPPFVVISGTVSSLGVVNSFNPAATPGVVSFMIGNTTVRMSTSVEASDNIQNGDNVKLEGFYVDLQNQVVSNNSLNFVTAKIDTWTPAQ